MFKMLFVFFLPPFLVGWPLEYGLCALTEKSRVRNLWRSLPFVAAAVVFFVWQGQINQPPTGDGPWCPTGAGIVNLMTILILFGVLAGLGLGWYQRWKKEKKTEEKLKEKTE